MTAANPIKGHNLRIARLVNQLSLHNLAQQLQISISMLVKMEAGITQPTGRLIKQLCCKLGISPSFLTNYSHYNIHEDAVFYVPTSASENLVLNQATAYLTLYYKLIRILKTQLRLPNNHFPKLHDSDFLSKSSIEQIADDCRFHWGLGFAPIENITSLIEKYGGIVTSFPSLYSHIDSMSMTLPHPIIVINQQKTACQIRFDIAMHCGAIISGFFFTNRNLSSTRRILEHFALSFLLPACSFRNEFILSKSTINWPEISSIQQRWGVSKEAIIYRAFQLKLINAKQLRYSLAKLRTTASIYINNYSINKEQPKLITNRLQQLEKSQQLSTNIIAQHLSIKKLLLTNLFIEFKTQTPVDSQSKRHNVVSLHCTQSNSGLPSIL